MQATKQVDLKKSQICLDLHQVDFRKGHGHCNCQKTLSTTIEKHSAR